MATNENRPPGMIETRAAQVTDVSTGERLVELIVMPYDRPALVGHGQRVIEEVINRGAFDGIETRAGEVRVNRDHRLERTVGGVVSFDPGHADGLAATLRIARTALGDETLELAASGFLDGSAGFRAVESRWERGDRAARRRRVLRGFLAHIALTPEPAYAEARVLAVRDAAWGGGEDREPGPAVPTPNLDRLRFMDLERGADLG